MSIHLQYVYGVQTLLSKPIDSRAGGKENNRFKDSNTITRTPSLTRVWRSSSFHYLHHQCMRIPDEKIASLIKTTRLLYRNFLLASWRSFAISNLLHQNHLFCEDLVAGAELVHIHSARKPRGIERNFMAARRFHTFYNRCYLLPDEIKNLK